MGTLVWDRIWRPGAEAPVEQWGGAVYSLSALSATCPEGWEIVPIMKVGGDLYDRARAHLGALPHLRLGPAVLRAGTPNNVVELRYRGPAEREEVQLGGVPAWSAAELEQLLPGLDALYFNFLSGCEAALSTAEHVRASFSGPIYADLHSLFLGPAGSGPRPRRPLRDWERWIACFDAVQLNEVELALLAGTGGAGEGFLRSLLDAGPELVLVTLGERGARYAARQGPAWGQAAGRGRVPPPDGVLEGDPTGCGDVWGSACLTGLLSGLPLEEAIVRAHRAAAVKIARPDTLSLRDRLYAALR